MPLTDIYFQTGDPQNFIDEVESGLLHSPIDIVTETSGALLVMEAELTNSNTRNIFIMSE